MRSFIAIEIDPVVLEKLDRCAKHIRAGLNLKEQFIKWVRPDRMHLTLKFLGDIEEVQVPAVCAVLDDTAGRFSPFFLSIGQLGTFGRPAAVLWAGIAENETLRQIHQYIEQQLQTLGFEPEDRQFAPHLTLARIKNPKAGREVTKMLKNNPVSEFGQSAVEKICLLKSELTKEGPVYTLLHSSNLA